MPPEIILLPVDKSSRTKTLRMQVMFTRVVVVALHYYAFSNIFYGRLLSARQVYSGHDVSFIVVWPHTEHSSPSTLVR